MLCFAMCIVMCLFVYSGISLMCTVEKNIHVACTLCMHTQYIVCSSYEYNDLYDDVAALPSIPWRQVGSCSDYFSSCLCHETILAWSTCILYVKVTEARCVYRPCMGTCLCVFVCTCGCVMKPSLIL